MCVPRTGTVQPQWLASAQHCTQLTQAWRVLGFLGAWPCLSTQPSPASGSQLSLLSHLSPSSQALELAWKCLLGRAPEQGFQGWPEAFSWCVLLELPARSFPHGRAPTCMKAWAGLILFLVWRQCAHCQRDNCKCQYTIPRNPHGQSWLETNGFPEKEANSSK